VIYNGAVQSGVPGPSSLSAKVAVLDAIICLTRHDIKGYKYGPLFLAGLMGGIPHRAPLLDPFYAFG